MANRENGILWFLAGIGIGTVAGILYAPRSGSETREVLRAKADEGRDFLKTRAQDARGHASEWVDKGRDAVSQQKEQIKTAFEAGKQAYKDVTTPSDSDTAKAL